jgi:dienelactone hydrolase
MKKGIVIKYIAILLILSMVFSGCSKTNFTEVNVEKVNFTTDDGVNIAGTFYLPESNNGIAVILSHQGTIGADQATWQPFADLISQKGFIALTYDFRGRGQSEGSLDFTKLQNDLMAAVNYVKSRGFDSIVCMGASMGGNASIEVALKIKLKGLVAICCTLPYDVTLEDLPKIIAPKLFICTEDDTADGALTYLAPMMKLMYDTSIEPKQLKIFPGVEHGTLIFGSENGDEFTQLLLNFLDSIKNSKST